MTISLKDAHVLVVGGSSGIGFGVAGLLLAEGARVTLAARDERRLAAAADRLGAPDRVAVRTLDVTDEDAVAGLGLAPDHVVVTAADPAGAYAPPARFDLAAARRLADQKLFGPLLLAKHLTLPPHGSMTVTSGIAAYRPGPGAAVVAAVNAGLEGLVRALALELAPVRVNVVSPGWVDTPIWETLAGAAKADRLAAMGERLPAGRVGTPADLAEAYRALLVNAFVTGTVLHVDGGHRLV